MAAVEPACSWANRGRVSGMAGAVGPRIEEGALLAFSCGGFARILWSLARGRFVVDRVSEAAQ
eukprot:10450099-Alexandrium_andersonii.AAC.1